MTTPMFAPRLSQLLTLLLFTMCSGDPRPTGNCHMASAAKIEPMVRKTMSAQQPCIAGIASTSSAKGGENIWRRAHQ